jgi:hypothetical protein
MFVLHLIDGHSPQACATTLALLADSLTRPEIGTQRLLLLGPTALAGAARAAGLPVGTSAAIAHVGVPGGRAVPGYFTARRRLADLLAGQSPDLVHCWSIGALSLASLMFRATPRVLTLTADPRGYGVRWLRSIARSSPRGLAFLPISAAIRRSLLTCGVPEPLVHILRPSIDLGRPRGSDRAALRREWGVTHPKTRIVALACDPPAAGDCLPAMLAVSLAASAQRADGYDLRLLVHPGQRHRRRAQNMMIHLGQPQRLLLDERLAQPWEVLPGCDMVLALGPGAGGLSLLWAMAASLPIVAEATDAVSALVEDHHSALLARPDDAKALAYRITQMLEDPGLAYRLRDRARSEIYHVCSRAQYGQALGAAYAQLIEGRRIEAVSPPDAGDSGALRLGAPV